MSSYSKFKIVIFTFALVAICSSCITGNALAETIKGNNNASANGQNEGSQTHGVDAYTSEVSTGNTGNNASRSSYTGVFGSWDTGIHTETVTSPNQSFSTPEVRYGNTVIPAMTVTSGDMAVGSEIDIVAIYAENSGYVYKDGVRTPVNQGDLIAYIPAGGLQRSDRSWSTAWSILNSSGKYGDKPISEALEYLYQFINNGDLAAYLRNNPKLTAWGGLKAIEKMSKEKIKELLCEDVCDVPITEWIPPISSCHRGSHAGWTEGKVQVNNFTKGTGWKGEVWARPGDTVRFSMYYCWGVGAVGGSADNNASEPWAIYPDGNATVYGSAVTDVWFKVSASPSDNYLFGYNLKRIRDTGPDHHLEDPHEKTISGAAPEISGIDGDDLSDADYDFLYFSPSNRSVDANNHNCTIFDFSAFTITGSHGYQIPGATAGSCRASNKSGNLSDAGSSFSQTITYSYDTAWQRYRHSEKGKCNDTCTWQKANPKQGEDGVKKYEDKDMNTLIENNTNVQSSPYKSLAAALGSGANNWGLIKKWANDTDVHGTSTLGDCSHKGCSANKWRSYPYYGCDCGCKTCKSCTTCSTDTYENGVCTGTSTYHKEDCGECGCDTCKKGPCWGAYDSSKSSHSHSYPGKSHYKPEKDYSTGQQQLGTQSSTATVHVPYSYRTATSATIQEGDVIYLGESVYSMFTASIIPRIVKNVRTDEAYATVVPGYIKAVEFIASADSNLSPSTGSSNAGGTDPCSYYSGLMISGCNTIWEEHGEGGMLNGEGRYGGKTYSSGSVKRVVPDTYPVGSKYCVAVGISTSDSHGQPNTQRVSGMSNPSGWRISGLSCRTIAKKPNFEVWNGNFYTKGGVNTSTTVKRVGANLGDPTDPTGYFGSWEEYLLSAKGAVVGFSSGAGLGYYGGYNSNSLGLQGGASPSKSYCDLSRMTIANDQCSTSTSEYYSNRYATGNSMIEDSATTLLERIRSRYTRSESSSIIRHLDNGATYIYSKGSTSTQALRDLPIAAGDNLGNTTLTGRYIMQGRGIINNSSEQTTSNYASNTLIIHVSGDLTINTNICAGNGTCTNRNDTLKLGQRNSDTYTSIYSVPQILIIVDGNIVISDAVTQIDAWLIANGNINTCNGLNYSSNGFSASACGRQLIVNGPVFANSLTLSRNSGANPGAGVGNNGGNPIDYNLTDDGSIQPAEIFNLRPDTLFWAYSQAQRYSQANVTYTRELAPRY